MTKPELLYMVVALPYSVPVTKYRRQVMTKEMIDGLQEIFAFKPGSMKWKSEAAELAYFTPFAIYLRIFETIRS